MGQDDSTFLNSNSADDGDTAPLLEIMPSRQEPLIAPRSKPKPIELRCNITTIVLALVVCSCLSLSYFSSQTAVPELPGSLQYSPEMGPGRLVEPYLKQNTKFDVYLRIRKHDPNEWEYPLEVAMAREELFFGRVFEGVAPDVVLQETLVELNFPPLFTQLP